LAVLPASNGGNPSADALPGAANQPPPGLRKVHAPAVGSPQFAMRPGAPPGIARPGRTTMNMSSYDLHKLLECVRVSPVAPYAHAAVLKLGTLLRETANRHAAKTALICLDRTVSYQELNAGSNGLARWFLANGLHPGDRVAIHWNNAIETVKLFMGCFYAGLVAVPWPSPRAWSAVARPSRIQSPRLAWDPASRPAAASKQLTYAIYFYSIHLCKLKV
jgi:AMP-binding enzyme